MVTHAENERLAVLETKVASIESDVSEIKADVKGLVASVSDLRAVTATETARKIGQEKSRADTGVWVRMILPWVVALAALGLGILNFLIG